MPKGDDAKKRRCQKSIAKPALKRYGFESSKVTTSINQIVKLVYCRFETEQPCFVSSLFELNTKKSTYGLEDYQKTTAYKIKYINSICSNNILHSTTQLCWLLVALSVSVDGANRIL